MGIVKDQKIITAWNASNKKRYESKGYQYTGINTPLEVQMQDLPQSSVVKIKCICDWCGIEFEKPYNQIKNRKKIACNNCTYKMVQDTVQTKYGAPNIWALNMGKIKSKKRTWLVMVCQILSKTLK